MLSKDKLWSTSEMAVYKAYAKQVMYPTVSTDGTVCVVRSPMLLSNRKSKHIFLYEVNCTR